jgi:alpha-ketoglutarate-dependent taurine dioxygenase
MTEQHAPSTLERACDALAPAVKVESWNGGLPYFISPSGGRLAADLPAAVAWVSDHREALDDLLIDVGAFVLRGFPVADTEAFDRLMASYTSAPIDYSGGATVRSAIAGRVYEATRAPADLIIPLHQEMAYLPKHPNRLAFFCYVAPTDGGETMIGDMRRYESAIASPFRDLVAERGVIYRRNFRSAGDLTHPLLNAMHQTWPAVFGSDDPAAAERACDDMGLTYRWNDDGSLTTEYRTSAFKNHPVTGQTVWFNQIAAQTPHPRAIGDVAWSLLEEHYPPGRPRGYDTVLGDGTPLDHDDVEMLHDVANEVTVLFPWRAGDVMVVDNFLTAHGRNRFSGDRDVQVMLLD